MNNSDRATALRSILSKELTAYEKECKDILQDSYIRKISYKIDNLENNEKNFKMLQAISYLLDTLEY